MLLALHHNVATRQLFSSYLLPQSRMMIDFNSSLVDHWLWFRLCVPDPDIIHLCSVVDITRDRLRHTLTCQLLMLVLEQHVVDWCKTNTCTKDVVDTCSLAEQRVDKWSTTWHEWSFAQEAQDRQHWMETAQIDIAFMQSGAGKSQQHATQLMLH